uniref:J domain-containing protein n=1 Tax=Chromera velia CCMP2878 TaxID=1169474 RepID=A0A0G4FXK1_9ALVE|eukprot:Cvel_19245.t1-p1 / transcript=Cvel_19245.t1 / gene=Cvel_19245 / organism=Chromera_velia_CCMP2878 / gene_product=hypothetical protein / transcript_product=hypothetical protein / location=Cvel_scaffold1646:9900-12886(+) / protein_length=680 / sequence_SO=supercontig / SO=protein_coding / is_pseudo=false
MGQSRSKVPASNVQALSLAKGKDAQERVRRLVRGRSDAVSSRFRDFYDLFGLKKYASIDARTQEKIRSRRKELLLQWHPDKNPKHMATLCADITAYILSGEAVLLDADKKHRYDKELRTEENPKWWNLNWYLRWGYSILSVAGGLACIGLAATATVASAGALTPAALKLGVAGSALLTSGIKSGIKQGTDPNCTTAEFIKDAVVGGVQGGAGGAIGAAAAPAMVAVGGGAAIGMAAGVGAGAAAASHVIQDGADLLVSSGSLGKTLKQSISDAKTTEEVFSVDNAVRLVAGVAVGAAAGAAAQAVSSAISGAAANKAAELADDVSNVSRQALQQLTDGKPVLEGMKMVKDAAVDTAKKVVNTTGEVARETAKTVFAKALGGGLAGSAVNSTGQNLTDLGIRAVHLAKAEADKETWKRALKDSFVQYARDLIFGSVVTCTVAGTAAAGAQRSAQKFMDRENPRLLGLQDMAKDLDHHDLEGHARERHVVPLEALETRQDLQKRKSPSSGFHSDSYQEKAVQRFSETQKNPVEMGESVGVAVRKTEGGEYEYTECSKANVFYRDGSLVTAYPIPSPDAQWQSSPPNMEGSAALNITNRTRSCAPLSQSLAQSFRSVTSQVSTVPKKHQLVSLYPPVAGELQEYTAEDLEDLEDEEPTEIEDGPSETEIGSEDRPLVWSACGG